MSASRFHATIVIAALFATATMVWWWQRHPPKQAKKKLSVNLQCLCGKVQVTINSAYPIHLVCYCDDCQGYARWLSQKRDIAKYSPLRRVVDVEGGTRVWQVFRSDIQVLSGGEFLTCTALDPSLVPKQRPFQLLRVHTSCCQTPMFSACWRELPVVGFFVANVKTDTGFVSVNKEGVWGDDVNDLLPAPEYSINTQWATDSTRTKGGNRGFPFGFLNRFLWRNFVVAPKSPCPWPLPESHETVVRMEERQPR